MGRFSPIFTNFTSGELSEYLGGRPDVQQYFNGASIIENFIPLQYGGVTRRPGTAFVAETKHQDRVARLINFEFGVEDAYIIELGHLYARFYRNGGAVLEADVTITGASATNPVTITAAGHGYANGDEVVITEIEGMTELNSRRFIVQNAMAGSFDLYDKDGNPIDGSMFTAYTSGGVVNRVYEIVTTFEEQDLFDIDYAQTSDKMYLVHQNYRPKELTRTDHTAWTLTDLAFEGGPFQPVNLDETHTMTPSAATGVITITSSAAYFTADMVGGFIRIKDGWAEITNFISSTVVDAEVFEDLGIAVATDDWSIGSWSDEFGYPGAVGLGEQRLLLGGTPTEIQTIWGSEIGVHTNFWPGDANDSDPITHEIADDGYGINSIDWISAAERIAIGTRGGIKIGSGGGFDDPITPDNFLVRHRSSWGTKKVRKQRIGENLVYIQRFGKTVRELTQLDIDLYQAVDRTITSSHITGDGISDMAYQQSPNSTLWCIRADGVVPTLTREIDQKVAAWARQIFAGGNATCHVDHAVAESTAVMPAATYHQPWFIIRRTIGGVPKRYVEYVTEPVFADPNYTDLKNAFFVDSGLKYDQPIEVTGITLGNPIVVTAPGHGLSNLMQIRLDDIVGTDILNGRTFTIGNVTADTFELYEI